MPDEGAAEQVHETDGPAETEALGGSIVERLRPGDVVLVAGELGTGKTTFVRGACRALGVSVPVTSPTFTIGQRYAGRLPVAHLDLFRLVSLRGEDPGLLGDYLGPDSVAFVEWPEVAEPDLAPVAVRVSIEHAGGDRRRVRIR